MVEVGEKVTWKGAAITIMSSAEWKSLLPNLPLQKSDVLLKTYTAEKMTVLGLSEVLVELSSQRKQLLTVVEGRGPSLLGRNWLH